MTAAPRTINEAWCRVLVDELVLQGLRHAVVCPGSRSTPLALALAERPEVDVAVVVDERAAGFVALGLSKGSGTAPLLLCTSGTAGAHFYPAIIEAHLTSAPIVVVTADRPPELHGFGAPQSLDQTRLFGAFAAFTDLGLPSVPGLAHLRALAAQAMSTRAVSHWNAPFREPLAPTSTPEPALPPTTTAPTKRAHHRARRTADPSAVDFLRARLLRAERPLIVCGPRRACDEDSAAVVDVARACGVPVVAELGSGLRRSDFDDVVIAHGEQIVRALAPHPDLVIHTGLVSTTRALQAFVDDHDPIVVGVVDPNHRGTIIEGDVFAGLRDVRRSERHWLTWWRDRDAVVAAALDADDEFGEGAVARVVVESAVGSLVLASSMPIRDAEAFGGRTSATVVVNRGAAGIDGLVSTSVGVARATQQPVTLLCGDLALLHDLHGLVAARDADVVVVVVNNDGGGIFSFLPVAQRVEPSRFEQLFGTPHGLTFKHLAAFAGATLYAQPTTKQQLSSSLQEARARGGLAIIEVNTDRATNVLAHERAVARVRAALEAA